MLFLLFNVCGALVSVQRQESVYSTRTTQKGGQKVTESAHHKTDVTQVGSEIMANEMHRKRKRAEEERGTVQEFDQLQQKAGKKSRHDAATRMREAMGFSKQLPGQPEAGQLTIRNIYNKPDSIAGVSFYPKDPPVVDTSKVFCDDGRCAVYE